MRTLNGANITNGEVSSANFGFVVEDGTILKLIDSYISNSGWDDSVGQRGLEINASDAILDNVTIEDSYISVTIYSDNVNISSKGFNADIHASAEYRAHIIKVMTKKAVGSC